MSNLTTIRTAFAGLQMAQAGMLVTSQNVAGASVDGFSRRRTEVVTGQYALDSSMISGGSFAIEGFGRDYSRVLEFQRGVQQGKMAEFDSLVGGTSTLDSVVLDAASSVGNAFDTFFAAAGALARDPNNVSFKAQFFAAANQVTERFFGVQDTIKSLDDGAAYGLQSSLETANIKARELAFVNEKIASATGVMGATPSTDLLDRRDQLLIEIQKEVGGQVTLDPNGATNLYINGMPLVDQFGASKLSYSNGRVYISLSDNPEITSQPLSLQGNASGRAKANFSLLNDFIPSLKTKVSEMQKSFADGVNEKLSGMDPGVITGLNLFTYSQNADGQIVDFRVRSDLNTTTSTFTATEATSIEAMRQAADGPIKDWAAFTTYVGGSVASWKGSYQSAVSVSQKLDADREKVSGVNLDEEAANLLRFQQLYTASTKVMQVGTQIFDTLLAIMR